MNKNVLIVAVSGIAIATSVPAQGSSGDPDNRVSSDVEQNTGKTKVFTTGVAKGRDMFDTAISASTLDDTDIQKISATSVVEIVGNIPGIRAYSSGTDGLSAITVRGLPTAADGSKFLQLQEDGLPVLEFGDIRFASSDMFLRPDLTLSQIQAIRGGSASTFASNAPGGVVNFVSKTGEVEGGTVQASTGLDYDRYRLDFDYGGRAGADWRFNVGGFYREGEGPRAVGYTAFRGGQIKANVTRELAGGGYIRLYGKYLNDRQPAYSPFPIALTGTDASPVYGNIPGADARRDLIASQYTTSYPMLDQDNRLTTANGRNGAHAIVKSAGLETQFDVGEWSITERFRFSANSGETNQVGSLVAGPASLIGLVVAGPGASFSYVNGPNAGQAIANPAGINGNGLLNYALAINVKLNDLNAATNDLRASRGWNIGNGTLTTTGGVYYSSQNIDMYWNLATLVQDVAPNGNSALVDVIAANGTRVTQNGVAGYSFPATPDFHRRYDVNYRVIAPYASLNYKIGALAIGGSLRLDTGKVTGRLFGSDLGGGRSASSVVDVNGDGVIQPVEMQVATLPLGQPGNVNYDYDYLSYSVSANYRVAESLSTFARYSRGARATAERLLFPPAHNPNTGGLTDPKAAFGYVKQAEAGVKFRKNDLSAYVTAFWASTAERNFSVTADAAGQTVVIPINRSYVAKGIELESEWRKGPFSMTLGATYARAEIDKDAADPTLDGNRPGRHANLFFAARPQIDLDRFTVGTQLNGTTSNYTQDSNLLKQPGYVIVSPYAQYRLDPRTRMSLNVFNVLDKIAIVNASSPTVPASGVSSSLVLNGRTITASIRFDF